MPESPYHGKSNEEWSTDKLISQHPLTPDEIAEVVLKAWDDIFNSKIGSFSIGKEIFPAPQILSFFLHELVARHLSLKYPDLYKVGTEKHEKDVHPKTSPLLSIGIKASSDPYQIFANRSYAQPETSIGQKNKNGYYITINFEKFGDSKDGIPWGQIIF